MNEFKTMKYPIGIQSFEKIRTEGFAYIDKTTQTYIKTPNYKPDG